MYFLSFNSPPKNKLVLVMDFMDIVVGFVIPSPTQEIRNVYCLACMINDVVEGLEASGSKAEEAQNRTEIAQQLAVSSQHFSSPFFFTKPVNRTVNRTVNRIFG